MKNYNVVICFMKNNEKLLSILTSFFNLNRKIFPDSRQRVRNKCTEMSVQKRNEMKLNINEMNS